MIKIQDLRKEKKLTQKRTSEIIGCHHKSIYDIENRLPNHLFIQYLKLLREKGVDLNKFFDENIVLKDHTTDNE